MKNMGRRFLVRQGPRYGDSYDTQETRKPSTHIEGESYEGVPCLFKSTIVQEERLKLASITQTTGEFFQQETRAREKITKVFGNLEEHLGGSG